MNRPTHSQARLSVAIVAALVAASAVAASPALAAATATEEYVLEFPGVGGTDNAPIAAEDGRDRGRTERRSRASSARRNPHQPARLGNRDDRVGPGTAADRFGSGPRPRRRDGDQAAYRNRPAAMTARPAARGTIAVLAAALACMSLASCGGGSDDSDAEIPAGTFVGVAPEGDQNATDYARMADGGVGVVRIVFQWSSIETSKGTYDWAATDQVMADIASAGLEPLVTVFGTPGIYEKVPTDPPTTSEDTFDAWSDFLAAAAKRYGEGGVFWNYFAEANPDVDAATDPRMGDLERAQFIGLLVAEAGPGRLWRADQELVENAQQGRSARPR